jgi:SAM-dependent methyltransferase
MLNAIFAGVPDGSFDRCLELGAGDGYLGTLVARRARLLVSTEIRLGRLGEPPLANTRYVFCDAELLPFRAERFDLVFSSHLLEHLADLPGALAGMRRVLRRDGVMVHLVPSRLWKLLDLGLFFPSQAVHVIEKYGPGRKAENEPPSAEPMRSTVKQASPGWWRRSFWPPVHGIGRSNVAELARFGIRRWMSEFERAELDVVAIRRDFPLHSPYRFGLERTRSLLESLGASSTVGFVLAHAGRRPAAADLFAGFAGGPLR